MSYVWYLLFDFFSRQIYDQEQATLALLNWKITLPSKLVDCLSAPIQNIQNILTSSTVDSVYSPLGSVEVTQT